MSLTLIPVKVRAVRANGVAVAGARVRAVLTVQDQDDGLVVPSSVEGTTDSNGEAVLNLWPNARGVNGSQYRVVVDKAGQLSFSGLISVPEVPSSGWPVGMETLINQPPYPARSAAEAAQSAAQSAAALALTYRNQAQAFAASPEAVTAAAAAQLAKQQAEASRAAAESAANATGPVTIFATKSAAAAGLSGVAANAFVEVAVDESLANRRTRYQKLGGVYVFAIYMDGQQALAVSEAQGNGRTVQDALCTQVPGHIGQFLAKPGVQPTRVLLTGTSIASFDNSALQVFGQRLVSIYGLAGIVQQLGVYGGTYGPSGVYKKQVFGGSGFYRLVMEPGQAAIEFPGVCDRVRLIYSKESDGGPFTVLTDGGSSVSLTSNGSQAYEQIHEVAFAQRGLHTITFQAPTSGVSYLERVEFLFDQPGIIIENATLGGSALANHVDVDFGIPAGRPAGNRTSIAINGNNGTDAVFNRSGATKPDLILCQHLTNDSDTAKFSTALNRALATTEAGQVPLVLLTEQPAVAFIDSVGVATVQKRELLEVIRAAARQPHTTLIDWWAMVNATNKAAYEARYFPGADKTHPTTAGHAIPFAALCSMFGISSGGTVSQVGERALADSRLAAGSPLLMSGIDLSAAPIGSVRQVSAPITGVLEDRVCIGRSFLGGNPAAAAPVYYGARLRNQATAGDTPQAITAAPTGTDRWGPYKTSCTVEFALRDQTSINNRVTVVILARRTGSGSGLLRFNSPSNNLGPRTYFLGTRFPVADSGTNSDEGIDNSFADRAPVFLHATVAPHVSSDADRALSLTTTGLVVYGVWVVDGDLPTVTGIEYAVSRRLGAPLPMLTDLTRDKVVVGQTYIERIDSAIIEKVALDGVVRKPLQSNQRAGLFRLSNRAAVDQRLLLPNAITGSAYDDFLGGVSSNANATPFLYAIDWGAAVPYSKTYTLLIPGGSVAIKVWFFNGGNNKGVQLNTDGSWSTVTSGFFNNISTLIPISSRDDLLALTFQMPASSFATDLGGAPTLQVGIQSPSKVTFATIVQGSSACV